MKNFNGTLIIVAVAAFLFGLSLGRWTLNPEIHKPATQRGKQLVSLNDRGGSEVLQTAKSPVTERKQQSRDLPIVVPVEKGAPQHDESALLWQEAENEDPRAGMDTVGEVPSLEEVIADLAFSFAQQGIPAREIEVMIEGLRPMQEEPPPPLSLPGEGS